MDIWILPVWTACALPKRLGLGLTQTSGLTLCVRGNPPVTNLAKYTNKD